MTAKTLKLDTGLYVYRKFVLSKCDKKRDGWVLYRKITDPIPFLLKNFKNKQAAIEFVDAYWRYKDGQST